MSTRTIFAVAAAASFLISPAAMAEGGGGGEWYWRLGGGISIPDDLRQDLAQPPFTATPGAPTTQETEADTGFNLGGGVGYIFNKSWRVEGELRYISADLGNVRQTAAGIAGGGAPDASTTVNNSGDASAVALMGNAILDINIPSSRLFPYFGGGVGYADVSLDGAGSDDGDGVFAYQFFLGMNVTADKSSWFSLQATYFSTGDVEYDPLGQNPGTFLVGDTDFTSTDITVSFNRKFN